MKKGIVRGVVFFSILLIAFAVIWGVTWLIENRLWHDTSSFHNIIVGKDGDKTVYGDAPETVTVYGDCGSGAKFGGVLYVKFCAKHYKKARELFAGSWVQPQPAEKKELTPAKTGKK